jgi:hypothetical protein
MAISVPFLVVMLERRKRPTALLSQLAHNNAAERERVERPCSQFDTHNRRNLLGSNVTGFP